MEKQLPKNWVEAELKEIISYVIGGDWGKDPDSIVDEDFVEILCIRGSEIKNWIKDKGNTASQRKIKESSLLNRQLIKGDILLEISGGGPDQPVGRTVLIDDEVLNYKTDLPKVCTNFLRLVRIHPNINSKLINHYLQYFYYSGEITKYQGGSNNLRNLKYKDYETISIPLPPFAEQNRIVTKLDKLFTQLETIKTSMEKIPVLLKDFRQQVLTQAVTGKLTEEWRKGKKLDEWSYELVQDCCEKVQSGGTPKGSNFDTSGIPFLKVYNIVNNKIDFEYNPQYVSEEIQNSQIKKSITYPGDVIMNIVGPPLNKIAIIPEDYPEWNLNQAITLFRTKNYLSNKFLYYFFCEGSSVNSLINETKGVVGQVNISLSQCRNFLIPVPLPQEQKEIVTKIESLFAKADAIEQQYKSLKEKIDTLPQALLHKAFKGELTEQLDSDGDARELLKQIQELKGSTTKVAKNSKLEKLKNFNKKVKNYPENEGVLGMVAEGK